MRRVIARCLFEGTKEQADRVLGDIEEWFSIRNLDIDGEQLLLAATSALNVEQARQGKERFAFVLDCDMSTQSKVSSGFSDEKVKESLQQCLRGLSKGTAFDEESRALFANVSVASVFMTPLLHPVARHDR